MKMTPMAIIRRKFSSARGSTVSVQTINKSKAVLDEEEMNASGALKLSLSLQEQRDLFIAKTVTCQRYANCAEDSAESIKAKEAKRTTLLEILAFINEINQKKQEASAFFTEDVVRSVITMISLNLFRQRNPLPLGFDPEEDEPVSDPNWPHKQVVYEILLRLVISPGLNIKAAKKPGTFDQTFLFKLIHQFESEDSRERDYLKTTLHRLYGKFFTHRKYIRDQISQVFSFTIDNHVKHCGIAELLEILGSIINGLSLPLKQEHLDFLKTSLLPLHKASHMDQYQQQLTYCMTQFVEKDNSIAATIICYLYNIWPVISSSKQLLFLVEIELILEIIHPIKETMSEVLDTFIDKVYEVIEISLESQHFQVIERALSVWNNQALRVGSGIFGEAYYPRVVPYILPAVTKHLQTESRYWNEAVALLCDRTLTILKQTLGEEKFTEYVDEIKQQQHKRQEENEALLTSLLAKTTE